ncbi:S8 family peptidase [Saccharibacillus sacchari]|uniref:S8 family peptidase n=1 Tax=Saccharibacillus sacchari TaxID=456493 RepID=UPI0004B7BA79|nr:S8 family serine peptidase [Saccharibacillus sacchari]
MRYVVNLSSRLSDEERRDLNVLGEILYESKFLPLLGIETNFPQQISELDFIENIREEITGEYQEAEYLAVLTFEPPLKKSKLINKQYVGWNSRIAILDSGRAPEIDAEFIDYTNTNPTDSINHGANVMRIIKHFAKGSTLYSAKIGSPKPEEIALMNALEWAADKAVDVINISASFKRRCNPTKCDLCKLINEIVINTRSTIVIAAGNENNKEDSIYCPGVASNAVTVGAVDKDKKVADYSSFGRVGGQKPNLIAPGTTYIDGSKLSGTSFAAPVITGIIGAMTTRVGSSAKVVDYMYNTIEDLGAPINQQGLGMLNLEQLVEVVSNEESYSQSTGQNQSS